MADLPGGLMILLMALGALLILIAAVGIVRMPDLLGRMQASSKAGTLGTILILAGVALAHGDAGVVVEAILVIVFLFLTAPVAAHVIARAAQRSGSVVSTASAACTRAWISSTVPSLMGTASSRSPSPLTSARATPAAGAAARIVQHAPLARTPAAVLAA